MSSEKPLKIDKKTIENATSCVKNKACLENPDSVCKVDHPVSESLLFVARKKAIQCKYFVNFGYDGFCTCPVRKEIYNKHKI